MAAVTTRRTATQWLALVDKQRGSGLSVAEFARREGLVYQTFIGWCRKADRGPERVRRAPKAKANEDTASPTPGIVPGVLPAFVELGIAGRSPRNSEHGDESTPDWLVELELGGGLTLRVRRAP